MLQLLVIFIALLIPVLSHADAIDKALAQAGFVETPDTAMHDCSSPTLRRDHYVVEQHEGSIRIVRKPHADKPNPEFSTRHIKYIGEDHGEFGGKLEAVWPDKHKKILLKKNIRSIIQSEQFLYIFTGLRHYFDRGAVYRISNYENNPKVSLVTLLPGESLPLLDSRGAGTAFIIITNDDLLSLTPANEWLNIIDHHSVWERFIPNSAIQVGDRVLVGMCSGVAVIEFFKSYDLKSIRTFAPEKTE